MLGDGTNIDHHPLQRPAQQVIDRQRPAPIGHMGPFHLTGILHHLLQQMGEAAIARRAHRQRRALRHIEKPRQPLRRAIGAHHQNLRHLGGLRHRREIAHRIKAHPREQRLIDRQTIRASTQGQPIRPGPRHNLITDIAARAGMVLHHHTLPQRRRHMPRQQPGHNILASPRRDGYDQPYRPIAPPRLSRGDEGRGERKREAVKKRTTLHAL